MKQTPLRRTAALRRFATLKTTTPMKRVSDRRKSLRSDEARWKAGFHRRSNRVCEFCESARSTQVHHLFETGAYPHLALHEANGLAVCKPCHRAAHEDLVYLRRHWAKLNEPFAALCAVTPDVAALLHREAA